MDPALSNHPSCLKYSQIILLNWYVGSRTKGDLISKKEIVGFTDIVKGWQEVNGSPDYALATKA